MKFTSSMVKKAWEYAKTIIGKTLREAFSIAMKALYKAEKALKEGIVTFRKKCGEVTTRRIEAFASVLYVKKTDKPSRPDMMVVIDVDKRKGGEPNFYISFNYNQIL